MTTRAAFWGVRRWSVTGFRDGALRSLMLVTPPAWAPNDGLAPGKLPGTRDARSGRLGGPLDDVGVKVDVTELSPGRDPDLAEHVAEMPLDGAGTEKQTGADLGIRQTLLYQPGDLGFLCGERSGRCGRPFADPLSSRKELSTSSLREGRYRHLLEHVVRTAEL